MTQLTVKHSPLTSIEDAAQAMGPCPDFEANPRPEAVDGENNFSIFTPGSGTALTTSLRALTDQGAEIIRIISVGKDFVVHWRKKTDLVSRVLQDAEKGLPYRQVQSRCQ